MYVIPGGHPGLIVPGNLDLWKRGVVINRDGSYSTVKSTSWNVPVKLKGGVRHLEVLMPEAYGGAVHSAREALNHFLSTGEHLGMFDNVPHAKVYADRLHNWFVRNAKFFPPPRRR